MHWRRRWQPTPVFLAWRIPGTGEPGGLPSMGSHRIGRDWCDLAAAAAAAHNQFSSAQSLSRVQLFVTPWTVHYIYIVHYSLLILKKSKHEDFNWILQVISADTFWDFNHVDGYASSHLTLRRGTHGEIHGGGLAQAGRSSLEMPVPCLSMALSMCSLKVHLFSWAALTLLTGIVS